MPEALALMNSVPGLSAGAGLSPRRARYFSLLRQRKVPKRKATPSLRPLRGAKGQTCVVSVAGCAVELTALRCSFVQTSTASQLTKHGRFDAHAHPTTAPPQAQPAGGGQPNIQTTEQPNIHLGHRCARPKLCSAWRLRPRVGAERSEAKQWPVWMSVWGSLLRVPRSAGQGGRACAEGHTHFVY